TDLGVRAGDRVAIYLPMIPEAMISMLACARLGAAHSVVFGGFSADALRSRIIDAEARVVITADGSYRRAKPTSLRPALDEALPARIIDAEARGVIAAGGGSRRAKPTRLKPAVDEALSSGDPPVEHVLVVERTGQDIDMTDGRDQWWHDTVGQASPEHECEF